jgi:peptidyl serine alpha-galactosyltransferase
VLNPNFLIHFTPDYGNINPRKHYKYFNKAFGVKHWMQHVLGYNFDDMAANDNNQHNDDLFVLLDPDQILLKPFVYDYTDKNLLYMDTSQSSFSSPSMEYTRVSRGHPMAQVYGLGSAWLNMMNWTHAFASRQAAEDSPAYHTSVEEYELYHISGPPYLVVGYDFVRIVDTWTRVNPPILDLDISFMSEMYAYLVAAAHHKLPHRMVQSFMISTAIDPPKHLMSEGWPLIINMTSIDKANPNLLPFTLHYCQRYYAGPWFFNKHTLLTGSSNILSCDHPLLAEPPANITECKSSVAANGKEYFLTAEGRISNSFMLYHLTRRINQGLAHYKSIHCTDGNYNKTHMQRMMT